jgi:hypothetical protein
MIELESTGGPVMDEDENTFPMDIITDLAARPWKFRPEGYLVVILADTEEGQRAESALVEGGFASRDVKLYTGKQILDNYEVYKERRTVAGKMAGSVVDDQEGRELYLDYAREDRCALWMRLPDEAEVPKALRLLADYDYLHTRYYGSEGQTDFHIS